MPIGQVEQTAITRRSEPYDGDEPVTDLAIQQAQQVGGTMTVASSRSAQEVQAAMVIAQKFPRNEATAYARIMRGCKRRKLAEKAVYAYPRGGQTVSGPSIRLAEHVARNWGNLDFGIVELEQRDGQSEVMAYCWDLETNTRQTKIFTVRHFRQTRDGGYRLTDPRDIYEMIANQGARRMRACILGVIPGDVVEDAVDECERTLKASADGVPIQDRIRKMVAAFDKFGVGADRIEKRLGHRLDATTEHEIANLQQIYTSLKDNMADPSQFFPTDDDPAKGDSPTDDLAARVANKARLEKAERNAKAKKEADKPADPKEAAAEDDDALTVAGVGAAFHRKFAAAGLDEAIFVRTWQHFVRMQVGKGVDELSEKDLAALNTKIGSKTFKASAWMPVENESGKEADDDAKDES